MYMQHSFGKISKKKDGFEVRFERALPYSAEVVWDAITNPDKLAIWFTDMEMAFMPGGKMVIRFRDENKTESFGKIIRIEPPRVFAYTWEDELATWEIFPEGKAKCKLILTYSRLVDSYAISVPAGWHVILDQLEDALGGRKEFPPFGGGETDVTRQMRARYAELVKKEYPGVAHGK
jgi:uncharacterized protein YndB with AHSA1/START domain